MKVRKRAILTVALVFSVALVILIVASQTTILAGFEKLEKTETETQVGRASDGLNRETTDLDALNLNNAAWDDTYQFVVDNNSAYIESNWNDQVLSGGGINFLVFVNNTGQIVYAVAFNTSKVTTELVYGNLTQLVSQDRSLWQFETTESYTDGLVNVAGSLFIVASRPILKSDFSGPIRGALITGRQVGDELVASLSAQTRMDIGIDILTGDKLPANLTNASANLHSVGSVYVNPESSSRVAGYELLGDVNGNPCAILSVSLPRDIYAQGSETVTVLTYLLGFFFLGFAVMSVLFLDLTLLSRVSRLTKKMDEMTKTEKVNQRFALDKSRFASKDDELSVLSLSINHLLDKIDEVTAKLTKSQRFAAIGELAVMVAHDLRNPLQGITVAADYLSQEGDKSPEKKAKMINLVKQDVIYCEKIVTDLLDYSREPKIAPNQTDVQRLLSTSLSHVQLPENVRINDLTSTDPKINVDLNMMTRVFDNMIKNAVEAMPQGGRLTIKSEGLPEAVRIIFEDTGKGIEKEDLKKMFVPLYTTKAKGMGFGLSICKRIVDAHKGSISVDSIVGKGTRFTIELPR